MTLTQDAKTALTDAGLDRDGALLAAKSLGQQIIDESASSNTPLEGMVYEVWGLYDEGRPACRFQMPNGDDEVVYEAHFRTEDGGTPVKRKRTLSIEALTTLVKETRQNHPA